MSHKSFITSFHTPIKTTMSVELRDGPIVIVSKPIVNSQMIVIISLVSE